MSIVIFGVSTPCSLVGGHKRFEGKTTIGVFTDVNA
jgi:hypothetical protein